MAASSIGNVKAMEKALGSGVQPTLFHPSTASLEKLKTLGDVMTLLNIDAPSIEAIIGELGASATDPAEELGMLPDAQMQEILNAVRVGEKKLTPMARSKAGMLGRYCRLLAGVEKSDAADLIPSPTITTLGVLEPPIPAVTGNIMLAAPPPAAIATPFITLTAATGAEGQAGPSEAAASGTPPVPAAAPTQVDADAAAAMNTVVRPPTGGAVQDVTIRIRKVQLRLTVDQNSEAEVDMMDEVASNTCYRNYSNVMRGIPRCEIEPALDQLTALLALIVAGCPPYVDLAIWGNQEFRDIIKPKLEGLRPQADGTWSSVKINGPENHAQWVANMLVFRCACIMLGNVIAAATIEEYIALIQHYVTTYGHEAWLEIYTADKKARRTHVERIRRAEQHAWSIAKQQNQYHPYDPKQPWDHCYVVLMRDQTFWQQNLIDPCVARTRKPTRTPPAPPSVVAPGKAPQLHIAGKLHPKELDVNGNYISNAQGIELCRNFNKGTCNKANSNGRCSVDSHLSHQCHICLLNNHPACRHRAKGDTTAVVEPPQKKRKTNAGKKRGA